VDFSSSGTRFEFSQIVDLFHYREQSNGRLFRSPNRFLQETLLASTELYGRNFRAQSAKISLQLNPSRSVQFS
jgi:hypothetical protein